MTLKRLLSSSTRCMLKTLTEFQYASYSPLNETENAQKSVTHHYISLHFLKI